MKKSIFKIGIVLSAIATISPSVYAGSIPSGTYTDRHPTGTGFTVRGNKFFEFDDGNGIGKMQPLSKLGMKSVKAGVLYDPSNGMYWCLVTKSVMNKPVRCSRNGWQRI